MQVLYDDDVPLIGQPTAGTCWAASIAMMLAWRHTPMHVNDVRSRTPVAAGQVADSGRYLYPQEITAALRWWGLVFPPGQTFTVQAVEQLLSLRGPLLVATYLPGSLRPHFLVITGLNGDGTPRRTELHINDPWRDGFFPGHNELMRDPDSERPNPGSRYKRAYDQFESIQRRFVSQENRGLVDRAKAIGGTRGRERWTETVRGHQTYAPEADCNYVAHWP